MPLSIEVQAIRWVSTLLNLTFVTVSTPFVIPFYPAPGLNRIAPVLRPQLHDLSSGNELIRHITAVNALHWSFTDQFYCGHYLLLVEVLRDALINVVDVDVLVIATRIDKVS